MLQRLKVKMIGLIDCDNKEWPLFTPYIEVICMIVHRRITLQLMAATGLFLRGWLQYAQ